MYKYDCLEELAYLFLNTPAVCFLRDIASKQHDKPFGWAHLATRQKASRAPFVILAVYCNPYHKTVHRYGAADRAETAHAINDIPRSCSKTQAQARKTANYSQTVQQIIWDFAILQNTRELCPFTHLQVKLQLVLFSISQKILALNRLSTGLHRQQPAQIQRSSIGTLLQTID